MTKKATTINTDNNIITVQCTTKVKESDPEATACDWSFDLDKFTHEEILRRAAKSLVIETQRLFRDGKIKADAKDIGPDDLKVERGPRKPSKKSATDFLAGLSPEERIKFLRENGLID